MPQPRGGDRRIYHKNTHELRTALPADPAQ